MPRILSTLALALMVLFLGIVATQPPARAGTPAGATKQVIESPISAAPAYAKRALVIGIDGYQNVPKLSDCDNDANQFADFLRNSLGFDQVTVMTDEPGTPDTLQPTYTHITHQLNLLLGNIVSDQTEVVIFFSGHGVRTQNSQAGDADWLVPLDADPNDIPDTCYNYSRFKSTLDTKRPARALLIMDACRNILTGKAAVGGSGFGGAPVPLGPQMAELLSCQPTQTSLEGDPKDFPESVFTHFLLKGLAGDPEAVDPVKRAVTFDSLMTYVKGQVSQYAQSHLNSSQLPGGVATYGGMVLARFTSGSSSDLPPAPTNSAQQYYQKGDDLIKAGNYSDAEEPLREAVLLDPTNASYQDDLGVALFHQKKAPDAEACCREAVRLEPSNASYQVDLGVTLFLQKKYPDAEACYREAVRLEPSNAIYQNHLGVALFFQQKYSEAESYIREAVRLDPSNSMYKEHLGRVLFGEQRYSDAEPYYREALQLDPNNQAYKSNLNNCLVKEGKSD